jgi:hypothetical protein
MARRMKTAAESATKWQQNFGAAGPAWSAGIDAVDVSPGQLAVAQGPRYLAGVQNSYEKWAANTGRYPLQQWKDVSKSKGASRLTSGAAAGAAKYATQIQRVLTAQASIIAGLPARGDINANVERSRQFQLAMHDAFKNG